MSPVLLAVPYWLDSANMATLCHFGMIRACFRLSSQNSLILASASFCATWSLVVAYAYRRLDWHDTCVICLAE